MSRLRFILALLIAGLLAPLAAAQTLVKRNLAYGGDDEQRFDVYAPQQARNAPVLFLIHGGGWRHGDKEARRVLDNKLARWLPRGFVIITTNYRLLPKARPHEQTRDIAQALAAAQSMAASWGGDRKKFILMGHSAGAHLIALLTAKPALAAAEGAAPWLGSVLLDSGALNVPELMATRHLPLFDQAFGGDPAYWQTVSPQHQLGQRSAPILAVCSNQRAISCQQSREFVAKAASFGTRAALLGQDLSHGEINEMLGVESHYTTAVEAFLRGLDPSLAQALN